MDFLLNELSAQQQFNDAASFIESIQEVMRIRQHILQLGSGLYCHRNFAYTQITNELGMQQVAQLLPRSERSVVLQWLTQRGPFWEDSRVHGSHDWIEVSGEIVTDSAVGEAAFAQIFGLNRKLVSFSPSSWNSTPISATLVKDGHPQTDIEISNYWTSESVQALLDTEPERTDSWAALSSLVIRTCSELTFAENTFSPLEGHPFVPSAAERIRVLLYVLNKFKTCFDNEGKRSAEGHRLYGDHFTGDKAWFSDSSDSEKIDFLEDLTFPHPVIPYKHIFCPFHGKVKTPQLRIHFTWPVRAGEPLYVAYVGPKLTKR